MTDKEKAKKQAEVIIKLDQDTEFECAILKRIAQLMVKEYGFYTAVVDGVKTFYTS